MAEEQLVPKQFKEATVSVAAAEMLMGRRVFRVHVVLSNQPERALRIKGDRTPVLIRDPL